MPEVQPVALLEPLGRPRERHPPSLIAALYERHGNMGAQVCARAHAVERGGDDARVVEHESIARLQQRGQLAHDPVLEALRRGARRAGARHRAGSTG